MSKELKMEITLIQRVVKQLDRQLNLIMITFIAALTALAFAVAAYCRTF